MLHALAAKIGSIIAGAAMVVASLFSSASSAQPAMTASSTSPATTVATTSAPSDAASTAASSTAAEDAIALPATPKAAVAPTVAPASLPVIKQSISSASISKDLLKPASDAWNISGTDPKEATVNVVCLADPKTGLPSITGSGTVISKDGVVLTNAHVAQYLLLEIALGKQAVDCAFRSGDPALFGFNAELLYISPRWIYQNAADLKNPAPRGTGENDFALLLIGDKIVSGISVSPLASVSPDPTLSDAMASGTPVSLYGYPTDPSVSLSTSDRLAEKSETSAIARVASFGSDTKDFFVIPAPADFAARGASGGGVFSGSSIVGMIDDLQTAPDGSPAIGAISLSYINRAMLAEAGVDLSSFISSDLKAKAAQFDSYIAPSLAQFLLDAANAR